MAKSKDFREQVYDVGNDCTVTVRYPANKRPTMLHNDTECIVRTAQPVVKIEASAAASRTESSAPQTNRTLSPEMEAKFQETQRAERAKRDAAAEAFARSTAEQGGAIGLNEAAELMKELETAALLASVPQ